MDVPQYEKKMLSYFHIYTKHLKWKWLGKTCFCLTKSLQIWGNSLNLEKFFRNWNFLKTWGNFPNLHGFRLKVNFKQSWMRGGGWGQSVKQSTKKQYDHIWKKIINYMIQIIKTTRQKNEKGGNGGSVFIENKEGRS